jgi:hypothetical protein
VTTRPVSEILNDVKKLAQEYYAATGKPLGVTGEIAESEAAQKIPGLSLEPARTPGYDAVETVGGKTRKLQIKGRCLPLHYNSGQRLGSIKTEGDWDAVLFVNLDKNLDATEIWEAPRNKVLDAINKPGSRSRNERYALSVGKFKQIGACRWNRSPDSASM